MTRQILKKIAGTFGITSSTDLWLNYAVNRHHQKARHDPSYKQWLARNHGWIADHWGHTHVTQPLELAHTSSQVYELTEKLRSRLQTSDDASVLDAGASDGMFLKLLGVKNGTGINILPACVEKIRADGYQATQANVEHMPFNDKSFDYVIFCQTMEHVLNPIQTLTELARVCRKKVLLSLAWLPRSRMNVRPAGWPEVEGHVFEFCPEDFKKIITYAPVKMLYHDMIQIFPEPRNPLAQWCLRKWMYPNYFPKLHYYELEPTRKDEMS